MSAHLPGACSGTAVRAETIDATQLIEGFDPAKLEAWIEANISHLKPPLNWEKLAGGHSNLTYRLTDSCQNRAVIRRPPVGSIMRKAHDMAREWSIVSALRYSPVPVPTPLAICDDPEVAGAPFYIMEYIEGISLAADNAVNDQVPRSLRPKLATNFITLLAALHAIEPEKIGLEKLRSAPGYLMRQLTVWHKSWLASAQSADLDDVRIHDLQRMMLATKPADVQGRIVHGDYGLHNCLIDQRAKILAVVDWEICTIGDPMADLAYALLAFPELPLVEQDADADSGFPDRAALAKIYTNLSGIDLSNLDFYYGFNLWRKAAIAHGVYARYRQGKKDPGTMDIEIIRTGIDHWLSKAEFYLNRWR